MVYEKIKKNFNLLSSLVNQIINLYVSSAMLKKNIYFLLFLEKKNEKNTKRRESNETKIAKKIMNEKKNTLKDVYCEIF